MSPTGDGLDRTRDSDGKRIAEVVGQIDVPAEARMTNDANAEPQSPSFGGVTAERARPVAEPEPDAGGHAGHVGAVVVAVGHERDAHELGDPRQIMGQREITLSHDDAREAVAPESHDTTGDRAREGPA